MAGSGPHQTSPHQVESANVHQQDDFLNLERERDRENYQEGSVHTIHTSGSGFRRRSHVSHKRDDNKAMQREIDDLKKQLHRAQQKQSPSSSDVSSNDEEDTIYRQRSRTPPSESSSYDEERLHRRKRRSPSRKGVGTVTSLRQLMDRVDKYKRIEDDQQKGKGKAKVIPQEMRDFRLDRYNNNRPRRDYVGQSGSTNTQMVNAMFREPIR